MISVSIHGQEWRIIEVYEELIDENGDSVIALMDYADQTIWLRADITGPSRECAIAEGVALAADEIHAAAGEDN